MVRILESSGYNNNIAVKNLDEENLIGIERFVSKNLKHMLIKSVYSDMEMFQFLPGHKTLLLSLPSYVEKYEQDHLRDASNNVDALPISFIMKELVKTAITNSKRDEKHRKFSEAIEQFATYIYMMCGKACYEILSKNLPFPQANTICKFRKFLHCQ